MKGQMMRKYIPETRYVGCCADLKAEFVEKLMSKAKKVDYRKLLLIVLRDHRWLYDELNLDWWNPYDNSACRTKKYYILEWSCMEYVFKIIE
jgi:hypothetical protein